MASRVQRERERDFLKDQDAFRRNAFELICKMWKLMTVECKEAGVPLETTDPLLDEMLHSIFFLGKVNEPTFSPESILVDAAESKKMYEELKKLFPQAFQLFSSHLPRRSPFSCVLDMIVLLKGREEEILSSLRDLIIGLKLGDSRELISSTLCVSHRTGISDLDRTEIRADPLKYYGVSIAAPSAIGGGRFNPRGLVIAASCLYYWDEYVAGAVLTYYPTKQKKQDYGTIQLPQWVRCQAFSLSKKEKTPPCLSCSNLFGLRTNSNNEWVYGNCAEVESLSNLFREEGDVKERARPTSAKYSDQKRDKYKKKISRDLKNCLKAKKFTWKEGDYYPYPK